MEYIGMLAFFLAISNMGLSDKVKKLKEDVKKMKNSMKGEVKMSEILKELEGKRCTLTVSGSLGELIDCEVINVDGEWMKVNQFAKKDQRKIRIIRIDNINNINDVSII
ncbi:hypothetical protein KPL35_07890 [Clostridium sp. CF011]|uniref:hypothetical protein n=1 Tax=unclassified Clostridium TaxID=2614128 RepID=UPI001C0E5D2B|nr:MULTISPECIES: hypothetical protein [unclassified Clostridium]MBU3091998.1 hypothetical protein [Clostridium sp. CF011]MBW9146585.1 hypothetical protein [Clostridium sp. CM027]UVE42267.1 hypothetical protein KTC92_07480 [Clostridium sp. CM027]WAG71284.1 hypothetical protein LL036_07730 [Clostridium sp. CF011]